MTMDYIGLFLVFSVSICLGILYTVPAQVIDAYKTGGQLKETYLIKILQRVEVEMKKLPNCLSISVPLGTTLTIVVCSLYSSVYPFSFVFYREIHMVSFLIC